MVKRDLAGGIGAKAERDGVHALEHGVGGRATSREHGEPVDAIAVAGQPLQMVEMQPNPVLAAGNLRWVGPTANDGRDADSVARGAVRLGCEHDPVANSKARVARKALVDRDRALGGGRWRDRVDALRIRRAERQQAQPEKQRAAGYRVVHALNV